MSIIELKNVSKSFRILNRHEGLFGSLKDLFSNDYRTVKAVENISFSIEKGETVGFVGPNGAGKSTTIKMMCGVLESSHGDILVNNYVPYKDRKEYVRTIGVVYGQRTQLWWELPVIESFKIHKEIYKISQKDYEENMQCFEELVNIKCLYSTPVKFLSLGQRMLCDIIAAFLHNPSIIYLDEPTIGLDISVKNKIRTIIKELNERKNTTVLLTTHDISDIEVICKRIIIIDKGTIVYDGDIQKINALFGAYRTLKLDVDISENEISNKMYCKFNSLKTASIKKQKDGWISLTFNQDEIPLLEILNFLTSQYPIKDIKVEDIETESIIRKIYDGELTKQ